MSGASVADLPPNVSSCAATLESMGFSPSQARRAAAKFVRHRQQQQRGAASRNGSTDRAANYLLSGASPLTPPPRSAVAAAPKMTDNRHGEREPARGAPASSVAPRTAGSRSHLPVSDPHSAAAVAAALQLQSPKRHLIAPPSPQTPYTPAAPYSPSRSDGSSSPDPLDARASLHLALPTSVADRPTALVGKKLLRTEPPTPLTSSSSVAPYRPVAPLVVPSSTDTPMESAESPLTRSSSSLMQLQLRDNRMRLDDALSTTASDKPTASALATMRRTTENVSTWNKSAAPPAYQSSLAALPAPPRNALQITPSLPAAASAGSASLASTPHANGPPSPSPSPVPVPIGVDPQLVTLLQPFLTTQPPPASLSPDAITAHAAQLGTQSLQLGPNSFIDVRDSMGKWLEAQVVRIEWIDPKAKHNLVNLRLRVHYLDWVEKWDETIVPADDPLRFGAFRSWSAGSSNNAAPTPVARSDAPPWTRIGEVVLVYFRRGRAAGWLIGRISKVDGLQVQVEMHLPLTAADATPDERAATKKVQRWFHVKSDLIMHAASVAQQVRRELQQQQQQQQQLQLRSNASPLASNAASPQKASAAAHPPVHHLSRSNSMGETPTPPQRQHHLQPHTHSFAQPAPSPPRVNDNASLSLQLSRSHHASVPSRNTNEETSSRPISTFGTPLVPVVSFSPSPPASLPTPPPPAAASIEPTATSSCTAEPAFFVGQYLEIQDSVGKFLPAECLQVVPVDASGGRFRLYIHFEGWSDRWNEWLDTHTDSSRIRALGSALVDTVEEKQRKAAEAAFRARLADKHGFTIFECDRDGNCLFRAFAHQIYGTAERHAEVRAKCYDHMERDRQYFSTFIAEDFDAYVKKRRQDKEWGDHIEVIALRECFNKNVEIYDFDSITGCQPMGMDVSGAQNPSEYRVPIVRLSFHGKNHYNSVVDPRHPPPLGDGSESPINMRQLRQAQEAKEAAEAAARQQRDSEKQAAATATLPPTPPRNHVRSSSIAANTPSPRHPFTPVRTTSSQSQGPVLPLKCGEMSPRYRTSTLLRDQSLTNLHRSQQLITPLQLQELWTKYDKGQTRQMDERYLTRLLEDIAELLHHSQRSVCVSRDRLEHLSKVYDEFRDQGTLESLARSILVAVTRTPMRTPKGVVRFIEYDSFAAHFFQTVYTEMMWELSK